MPDGIESRQSAKLPATSEALTVANHHLVEAFVDCFHKGLKSIAGISAAQIQTRLTRFEELIKRELQKPLDAQNIEAVIATIWRRIDTTADRVGEIISKSGDEDFEAILPDTNAEPSYA